YDFPGQDDEYKRRRAELLAAEIALKDQVERVAALRRALPVGMRVHDYAFREGPPDLTRNDPTDFRDVRLSELFTGGHDTLLVETADPRDAGAPGLSVFTRAPDGAIYHRYTIGADFDEHQNRGIDLYSPVWQLLDLLPAGRGDWYPAHDYMEPAHPRQPSGAS